jgi:hypothetical protein
MGCESRTNVDFYARSISRDPFGSAASSSRGDMSHYPGGEAVGRHPRKTEENEPTPEGVAAPSIKIPRVVFHTGFFQELDKFLAE